MAGREKEILDLTKSRIQFTTPEGEYEGTVHAVCSVTKKILVSKIVFLPKRTPMGTLNFNFREILTYTILSKPNASDLKTGGSTHQSYSYAPARGKDTCILDQYSDAEDQEDNEDVCVDDLYEEEAYEMKIPRMLQERIPMDNTIIDRVGEEFHNAVKHIYQQDCIGVTLEGPKIGRNGIVTWLGMSTPSCTFIFDIQNLGMDAFKLGLRKIFESPNIEKVFHDCRQASDCLYHDYTTRLVNVFDTQVADLLVTMQRRQEATISKRVSSIDTCLRTYLEIPEEYIHKSRSFRSYQDEIIWSKLRPMKPDQRDVILKNVMYLRLLKRELNLAMLTPFHRVVEIYLNVLPAASDQELLLEPSTPEELPYQLMVEGIQVVKFKEFVDVPPVVVSGPPYRKLHNPFKDYVDYCDRIGKSQGHSQSRNDNEYLSDADREFFARNGMPISSQVSAPFHKTSKVVENGICFHSCPVPTDVQSSNLVDTSTIERNVLQNVVSPTRQACEQVDLVNSKNSGEKEPSPLAQYYNYAARRRLNQSLNSNAETHPSSRLNQSIAEQSPNSNTGSRPSSRFNQSIAEQSLNSSTSSRSSSRFNQSIAEQSLNSSTSSHSSSRLHQSIAEKSLNSDLRTLASSRLNQSIAEQSLNSSASSRSSSRLNQSIAEQSLNSNTGSRPSSRFNQSIAEQSLNPNLGTRTSSRLSQSSNSTGSRPSANSIDSSDSEVDNKPHRKSYQDILIDIRDTQKPQSSESSSYPESSSDCIDSSDDDPWAAMRAEFSLECSAANVKTNFRYAPA